MTDNHFAFFHDVTPSGLSTKGCTYVWSSQLWRRSDTSSPDFNNHHWFCGL